MQWAKYISLAWVTSVQRFVELFQKLNEGLLNFYLPVLLNGGADNFVQNILIAFINYLVEWMQLATVAKAFSAGLKVGLLVLFIRLSLRAAMRLSHTTRGLGKRFNHSERTIALSYADGITNPD